MMPQRGDGYSGARVRTAPRAAAAGEGRVSRTGWPAHIDFSVGDPDRSIPFYAALLETLGYRRCPGSAPAWQGPHPTRATWSLDGDGMRLEIELRPARPQSRDRRYDRTEPGPHHIAFHAASRAVVDAVHAAMTAAGAVVLDPPADYSGQPSYEAGYYAAFFEDPDGFKLEVVFLPGA
jgi:catechol 2,3-dioxygenase-like lactoylglutathione lyase family enzyme